MRTRCYIARLWLEDIHTELLFERETERLTPTHVGKASRAPSWSWAALEGEIKYPLDIYGDLRWPKVILKDAEVVGVDTVEAGARPMGRTDRAALAVDAVCRFAVCDQITPPGQATQHAP
jgi:hypothetical protein